MGATQSSLDESDLDMDSTLDAFPGPTERALLTAVLDGDVRRLKDMVRTMDVEDRAKLADMDILKGVGLLGMASYIPQMKVCKYLVEELGLDVNAGGSRGGPPPLASAALSGKFVAARYLLNHGADPNKIDGTGFAPLHSAAKNRSQSGGVHGAPLHTASSYGTTGALKILLDHHADVMCKLAPLHTASSYGTTGALKILLDHHADPNRVSEVSGIPLITALDSTKHGLSESDSLNCVKLLVKDEPCNKAMDKIAMLKSRGEKAVKRKDYLGASKLYSEALELDSDATLYSNRSLCYLRIGQAQKALLDADACIAKRPNWAKGYYRKGVAHMSLKEHKKALDALLGGLKLEPANAEIEKVLWEALEALKKDHVAGGSLESTD